MDNITNTQINTRAFLKRVTIITAFTFSLFLYITSSNVYAEPPHGGGDCETLEPGDGVEVLWCCWTETDPTDPEKIEIYECQVCNVYDDGVDCNPPVPDPDAPPTTGENIVPEIEGGIEQPPSQNTPPIKSDNSFPNDDDKVLDEQQSNPNTPLTNQRVPAGNVGILEQLEDSANSEQNQESEESTDTNNAETASKPQEIDDSSNSETTTSLSKRGNTQNSPVPPECPTQGPIPPDCTMKPKF